MKKQSLLYLMTIILMCSGNAQNSGKQSISSIGESLAWANIQDERAIVQNPEISAKQPILFNATCYCVISTKNLNGEKHMSDVCTDLTAGLNVHYSGAFPMKDDNRQDCTQKCGDYALQYYQNLANKQSLANCACAEGLADGSIIRAYGAVGTKEYEQGQSVGVLINTPAVTKTTCTCPSGWLSDVTNINGGVTPTGKCK